MTMRLTAAWTPLVLILLSWRVLDAQVIEMTLSPSAIVVERDHLLSTPLRAAAHLQTPRTTWDRVVDRAAEIGRGLLFVVEGDEGHHSHSTLALFADGVALGPAHVAHDEIAREGGGRYSHWSRRLFFSLPETHSVAGSRAAQRATDAPPTFPELIAVWRVPPRQWVVLLLLLSIACSALTGWRKTRAALRSILPPRRERRCATALALTIAAAFAVPWLDAGAVAWWLPPPLILTSIGLGTIASIVRWSGLGRGTSAFERTARRAVEVGLLPLCVLVACATVKAASVETLPEILPGSGFTIAGAIPLSDSASYAAGADAVVDGTPLNVVAARRPLLATSHAAMLALGGSWEAFNWVQAIVLAGAVAALGMVLVPRFGPWTALGVAMAMLAWTQGAIATVMSEPLGGAFAASGLVFMILGAERRSPAFSLTGLFALALSSLIRPGAMLALPLIAAAIVITSPPGRRRATAFGAIGTLAAAAILPTAVLLGLGSYGGAVNSNLSNTMLGLATGTNWHEADERFAAELAALRDEREQSEWRMRKSWELIRADPGVFAGSLWRSFVTGIEEIPESAWFWSRSATMVASGAGATPEIGRIPSPVATPPIQWAGAALWIAAAIVALVRGRRDPIVLILVAWTLGILFSLPIIWTDGGWRAVAGSTPLFALLFMLPAWATRAGGRRMIDTLRAGRVAAGMLAAAVLAVAPAGIAVAFAARGFANLPREGERPIVGVPGTWTILLGPRTMWLDARSALAACWPDAFLPVGEALRADPTLAVMHLTDLDAGRRGHAIAPRALFDAPHGRYHISVVPFRMDAVPDPWYRVVAFRYAGAAPSTDAP